MRGIFLSVVLAALLLLPVMASAQLSDDGKPTKTITDTDIGALTVFSRDTVYILNSLVYVENGEVLVIEPGTIIKGNHGQDVNSKALVVARGGKLYASGTPQNPIIFTSVDDDLDDPDDISFDSNGRGLWGGVILCGYAVINTTTGVGQSEGISPNEPRAAYGGNDDHDCSGIIRYVSIRHGGTDIGDANEINGLTMNAVGDGTVIEYVEVFMNKDDGFQWFGGTVNCRFLVASFNGDDAFDYDEGYRGRGQFWFCYYDDDAGSDCAEHDGGTTPEDGTPYAVPVISNATYIGSGAASNWLDNAYAFLIRDNAGGKYYNSIFTDMADRALSVENLPSGADSRIRLAAGDLHFHNNIWWDFGAITGTEATRDDTVRSITVSTEFWVRDSIFDTSGTVGVINALVDPGLTPGTRDDDGSLDPVPATGGPADTMTWYSALPSPGVSGTPTDPWFYQVDYIGAFDPDVPANACWIRDWTAVSYHGFLDLSKSSAAWPAYTTDYEVLRAAYKDTVTVNNTWIQDATDSLGLAVFNKDTVYVLDTLTFIDSLLVIEPGTVIKGNPGQGSNATALIVTKGARCVASGAGDAPIIFTSSSDTIIKNDDYYTTEISFDDDGRGLWGGLILLGKSWINTDSGVGYIPGLGVSGAYGTAHSVWLESGTTALNESWLKDNSGVYRYLSIRHGGVDIDDGNEISGLTMGAVGSGTVIDHIEVFMDKDDGFEWLGGTVDTRYLISTLCGGDGFVYDEGFHGRGQFWFTYFASDAGIYNGDHEGGTTPEDGTPWAQPVIANATYIGSGASSGQYDNAFTFIFKDNAAGHYFNSIFNDMADRAISVEDLVSGEDSRARLAERTLRFRHNYWYGYGAGNTVNDMTVAAETWVRDSIFSILVDTINGNYLLDTTNIDEIDTTQNFIVDPDINDVGSRELTMSDLDPRIDPGSPAASNAMQKVTCCIGFRGNANCSESEYPDISDIVRIQDWLYLSGKPLCCFEEGDVDGSGVVDISDVTRLVDHLYISKAALALCDHDPYFEQTEYHGAFDPNTGHWLDIWTFLRVGGFTAP